MIINYTVPLSRNRKAARICCKVIQFFQTPFAKRRMLTHLSADDMDYRDVPVIINNYNRLRYLSGLIDWLERAGMRNIYIIDNNSDYPDLLKYYNHTKHTVIRLNANLGYKALWDSSIHLWFKGLPYIYTDPDVLPVEECPLDAVKFFLEVLNEHREINKVGFGLRINDIPDFYPLKAKVVEWESKFWNNPLSANLFRADIDTTFALYRPFSVKQQWGKTIRTNGKYMARHLPWYENPNDLQAEDLYYKNTAVTSSWCR
ncbi:MAG: hypothetical protein ABFD10_13030 [Prolixibacteraceae bacterium]